MQQLSSLVDKIIHLMPINNKIKYGLFLFLALLRFILVRVFLDGVKLIKITMLGSLEEFIDVDHRIIFPELEGSGREKKTLQPLATTKRRGKSVFESYTPDDKTDLLVRYEKNNIFNINRKKYNVIAK